MIGDTELKQVVYAFKCNSSTLQVKGKLNSITLGENRTRGCSSSTLSRVLTRRRDGWRQLGLTRQNSARVLTSIYMINILFPSSSSSV